MKIRRLFLDGKYPKISGLFNIACDGAVVDGTSPYDIKTYDNGEVFAEIKEKSFKATASIKKCGSVYVREDEITNTTDKTITLNRYLMRFAANSDDMEIFTQHNHWTNESKGEWQKLVTEITSENIGIRIVSSYAPFMAVWDNSCNRGISFNLFPNADWKMSARRPALVDNDNCTVFEFGFSDSDFALEILPGETIKAPKLVFYDFDCRLDMGSYKLHEYCNTNYPRKRLPVIYNTWFANFDCIDYDFCLENAKRAAKIGAEYFVVDAGWFGDGKEWAQSIGEWRENLTGAFCGRLREFAGEVRKLGMKFGIWIEAERALDGLPITREHPEYFIKDNGNCFVDYSNPEAVEYIKTVVCDIVDKYGAQLIKFDFNADCTYDGKQGGFYRYHQGHRKFVDDIRKRYKDIYIENCASGGKRLDLFHYEYTDGTWFSDNQSPYDGVTILKNSYLRMPPAYLERWSAFKGVSGFTHIYTKDGDTNRLVAPFGATWQSTAGVTPEYFAAFCAGGPFGITADLTSVTDKHLSDLKAVIDAYKEKREFYMNAVCRLLVDSEYFTVLQYNTPDEKFFALKVYDKISCQQNITVYPKLKGNCSYGGVTAKEMEENGIDLGKAYHYGNEANDFCILAEYFAD